MTADQPLDLYAELKGRQVADILNATTRPTRREDLLELVVVAISLQGNNGELRFPRVQFDQAAIARRPPPKGQGRRLVSRFDPVTFEYVVTLTKPVPTEPEQQELSTGGSDHAG